MLAERPQRTNKASTLRDILLNTAGTTALEYALISGALAIMIIVPLGLMKNSLRGTFTRVGEELADESNASPSPSPPPTPTQTPTPTPPPTTSTTPTPTP